MVTNSSHLGNNSWSIRDRTLSLAQRPLVMGILNVTPDSFSDGGQNATIDLAVKHALAMQDDGADIIDIGGESTRPYSDPVDSATEMDRVLPVINQLTRSGQLQIPISIDTSKSSVAAAAIDAGAAILNDVTGLSGDPSMIDITAQTGVGVVAMHMKGTPQTMQANPEYADVVEEIVDYLRSTRDHLVHSGIELSKICLDPGIGFGKTHDHNWDLVRDADRFLALGCPVLIGHSRKGFIGKCSGPELDVRDAGTLGITLQLAAAKIQIVRVHDVRRTAAGAALLAHITAA